MMELADAQALMEVVVIILYDCVLVRSLTKFLRHLIIRLERVISLPMSVTTHAPDVKNKQAFTE
jgi:hypothetical protein